MIVTQRVYFGISSLTATSETIAAAIGLENDPAFPTRGKNPAHGSNAPAHYWQVGTGLPEEQGLMEQLDALLNKLGERAEAVRICCEQHNAVAAVHIGRYYEPSPTDAEMGFILSRDFIDFLHRSGATLGFDEYDYSAPEDPE